MVDIAGGDIISRWILQDKDFTSGIKRGLALANTARQGLQNAFSTASGALNQFRGKAEENAGSMATIAATVFAPMILSVVNFANQHDNAIAKITELQEKIKNAPPYAIPGIQAEISRLQSIEQQTRLARQETDKLAFAGKALAFEIGKLVFEALQPFFGQLINYVRVSIAWIQVNRELAENFIVMAAKIGALFLVIAPGLVVIGKLSGLLASLFGIIAIALSPVGIITIALAGLAYIFRDSLYPAVEKILPKLQELYDKFKAGEISSSEFATALGSEFLKLLNDGFIASLKEINKTIIPEYVNTILEDYFYKVMRDDKTKENMRNAWAELIVGGIVAAVPAIGNALIIAYQNVIGRVFGEKFSQAVFSDAQGLINSFIDTGIPSIPSGTTPYPAMGGIAGGVNFTFNIDGVSEGTRNVSRQEAYDIFDKAMRGLE